MSSSQKKKQRKQQQSAAMTERQKNAQKEAKELKGYTITFIVAMVLVVVLVATIILQSPITGMINRATIAVTIGEHQVDTGMLSYFYIDAINNRYQTLYNYYGQYATYFLGFDVSKPLDEQIQDKETGATWADYFVDTAIEDATSVYALYDLAMAEGHQLTEDEQANLTSAAEYVELYATAYGYSNVSQYLKAMYGPGATEKSYNEYTAINAMASSYYTAHGEELRDSYTVEDFREYEKGKEKEYSSFNYLYYKINVSNYIEGEKVEQEDGTKDYTAEQKAAALEKAMADRDILMSSDITDFESFNKAIQALEINKPKEETKTEKSTEATEGTEGTEPSEGTEDEETDKETDKESTTKLPECTKAEDVLYSSLLSDLKKWLTAEERKEGDLGCVELPVPAEEDEDSETTGTTATTEKPETTGFYIVLFQSENLNEMKLVDIRHILIKPTGGTYNSSTGQTTYTDAEKAAALKTANELLTQWKQNPTKENFIELCKANSKDSNAADGGIYEDVYPGQMVTEFNDWCFAEGRQVGDTGVVETTYGAHVMYFEGFSELTYRDFLIRNAKLTEEMEDWHESIVDAVTVTRGDLSRMETDYVFS